MILNLALLDIDRAPWLRQALRGYLNGFLSYPDCRQEKRTLLCKYDDQHFRFSVAVSDKNMLRR
jgi:hypothetical protein